MNVKPFQPCCRKAAIEAFKHKTFYLVGCESCGTCFSITDDLLLFLHQAITYHTINPNHPHPFDLILSNGKIIFMLP